MAPNFSCQVAPALWRGLSLAAAKRHGVYVSKSGEGAMAWKRTFFGTLWPALGKWATSRRKPFKDFKIEVCVRFRAREEQIKREDAVQFPLHQYLKVQRQRRKEVKGSVPNLF